MQWRAAGETSRRVASGTATAAGRYTPERLVRAPATHEPVVNPQNERIGVARRPSPSEVGVYLETLLTPPH